MSQEHHVSKIVWLIECIHKMMAVQLRSGSPNFDMGDNGSLILTPPFNRFTPT